MAEKRNLIRFLLGVGLVFVALAIRDHFPSRWGSGAWGLALYAGLLVLMWPRSWQISPARRWMAALGGVLVFAFGSIFGVTRLSGTQVVAVTAIVIVGTAVQVLRLLYGDRSLRAK
jgi:hypothetical protein